MRVISSRSTLVFYRYLVLPLFWLWLIAVSGMFLTTVQDEHVSLLSMAVRLLVVAANLAVAAGAIVYFWRAPRLMKPFADEVRDTGDALIVRKSDSETRIQLTNIASMESRFIRYGDMYYLLTLRAPCSLGSEVVFFPINNGTRFLDGTPWQSKRQSIYDDLRQRINQARLKT